MILDDHRMMEDLLRLMRSIEADRQAALNDFAQLMIAHGEAEETSVHPVLMPFEETDTVEHIEAAHREALKVLLALLEVREIGSAEWDWRLKQLASVTARHIDEEERTLVNRACESLSRQSRAELAAAFARTRADLLDARCGSVVHVQRMVHGAPSYPTPSSDSSEPTRRVRGSDDIEPIGAGHCVRWSLPGHLNGGCRRTPSDLLGSGS
ncbi:hemerythrin domain-containing protein [Streptomyces sp. SA15]|uniref:hemerythrin domain-containing protein n=1 Tax=Streptomyces sp. SA15 TaxID=934019 RepID=UPI0027B96EDF|nr:hemerythrin domain-containing protein [Streptomyces sp. SA15]